jgi:hypothetical protein
MTVTRTTAPRLPTTSGAHVPGGSGGSTNDPVESKLVEVPVNLFYPSYPDAMQTQARKPGAMSVVGAASATATALPGTNGTATVGGGADYSQLLAQAAASHQPAGQWGDGQERYMLEEKDIWVRLR